MRAPIALLGALAWLAALAACDRREATPPPAPAGQGRVLATVNGVAITDADLRQRDRKSVGAGAPQHDPSGDVLQTLVREELILQQATTLGLEQDPEYRQRLEELEAQVRAFRRQQMVDRWRRWVREHAAVSQADARAWFDQNAALVRGRFHVQQLLSRGRLSDLDQDHQALVAGTPFDQVAARRFAGVPITGRPPWDLGELRWFQLPKPWLGVVDRLQPGQVSGIIKGDGERYWVVRLAGRTDDPAVTFETEQERIVEVLRQRAAEVDVDRRLAELKDRATITYPAGQ